MADDKALKKWVADKLHDILGYSDGTVAAFIVSVAKKHTSPDSLATALRQQGLPATDATTAMARDLLARLPRAGAPVGPSAAQIEARQAKQLLKKNATYGLLDDPDPPPPPRSVQPEPSTKPEKESRRGLRDKSKHRQDDDEEDQPAIKRQIKKRSWEEDDDAETAEARGERLQEAARLKDQQEKEEFETRLRQRDEQRTKKMAEDRNKLSKAEQREQEKRKCVCMEPA